MVDLFRIGALVCERDDPSRVGRYLGTGSSYRGASSAGKHLMKELGAFGDYDHDFLGGVYVRADNLTAAISRSHELGVNPGGDVLALGPIPNAVVVVEVPSADRERLLGIDELGPGVMLDV